MFQPIPILRRIVLIVVLMLIHGGPTRAEMALNSANNVMVGCRSYIAQNLMDKTRDQFLEGVCVGVFLAVWNEVPGICAPEGSILNQAIKVTLQYLDNRPARLHEPFNELATEALKAAWPCKP
jgi:hypothetical protein